MRTGTALAMLAAVVPLVAACSTNAAQKHPPDASGRDAVVTDPRAAICADAGSTPPFEVVQQVFNDNCTVCHNGGPANIDLLPDVSWGNLVQKQAPPPETCGGLLVTPGDPSASYLYQKLTTFAPCSGQQMPLGEIGPSPLPTCVTDIIRNWIMEGAPGPVGDAAAD
jgi:cytochrome c5